MKWKTCTCAQLEEPRLYARATQIAQRDPDPRRRLFQPRRATLVQPRTPRRPVASTIDPTTGRVDHIESPATTWESDFSEHSEWEQDWEDDSASAVPTDLAPSLPQPTSNELSQAPEHASSPIRDGLPSASSLPTSEEPAAAKGLDIQNLMMHLRENHECSHKRWLWVKGPHQCEECHHRLPSYIFECKQCLLQACNRCRRNRLR